MIMHHFHSPWEEDEADLEEHLEQKRRQVTVPKSEERRRLPSGQWITRDIVTDSHRDTLQFKDKEPMVNPLQEK